MSYLGVTQDPGPEFGIKTLLPRSSWTCPAFTDG